MDIKPFTINDFDNFYPLLQKTFPKEELLPKEMHYLLFQRSDFFGRHYNDFSTFVIGYQLKEFLFIELYTVQEHLRGQGIGSRFLETILKSSKTPVILEVELPTDDITKRRIKFYQRLGFHLNTFDYEMPQFENNHGGIPLYIMSYPHALSETEFLYYKKKIYQDIYLVEQSSF